MGRTAKHRRARQLEQRRQLSAVLDAAEEDPGAFVKACTDFTRAVVNDVRSVGQSIQTQPDEFRQALRDDAVRFLARGARDALLGRRRRRR